MKVGEAAIDMSRLCARVGHAAAGALATFAGTVRDHHEGKRVARLEYEAYVPMAERTIHEIASEAAVEHELLGIAVAHRVGVLEVGDVAVGIAVSSAHRAESFAALRFLIDEIKVRAPIWKRETGPDGTFWIEGPEHVPAAEPDTS